MTTGRINQVVSSLSIETADQEERQLQQQRPAATGRVEKLSKAQGGSLSRLCMYLLCLQGRPNSSPCWHFVGISISVNSLNMGLDPLFLCPRPRQLLSAHKQPPPLPRPPLFSCCFPQLAVCGPPWTRALDPVLEAFGRNPGGCSTAPGGAVPLARSLPF